MGISGVTHKPRDLCSLYNVDANTSDTVDAISENTAHYTFCCHRIPTIPQIRATDPPVVQYLSDGVCIMLG